MISGWASARLPPTGRTVRFPLCGIFTFDNEDRLAKIYYDRVGVFHEPDGMVGRIEALTSADNGAGDRPNAPSAADSSGEFIAQCTKRPYELIGSMFAFGGKVSVTRRRAGMAAVPPGLRHVYTTR